MFSIYILRKNIRIRAIFRLGKKGRRGKGVWFHMGALRERALENSEVFCFLYFYSSQKITKYFAFCIFIVVQFQFQLELQLEVQLKVHLKLELELKSKLEDSGFPDEKSYPSVMYLRKSIREMWSLSDDQLRDLRVNFFTFWKASNLLEIERPISPM